MSGLSDYAAEAVLNWEAGRAAMPALASRFLALFTAAPTSDAGTGGTEVPSSNGYARVQVAGALTAGASWTTSSSTITLAATAPAWLLALGTNGSGVNVWDATNATQIGTVSSISGTTVTLTTTAAANSSGSADSLVFAAFGAPAASSGSDPATTPASITSGATISYPQATGSGWGTAVAWGEYDAATGGNLITWDYLGNYGWQPCTITSASPGVFTVHAHGYSAADTIVYTTKYDGTQPSFSQSNLTGLLAVVGPATDTFTVTNGGTAVNTSSSGDGQVRKVASQAIAGNVTFTIPGGSMILSAA